MEGPWTQLPPRFAMELRKERQSLAAEIIKEIRQQVPEFSRPLAGNFGAAIQQGVETALEEFTDLIEGDDRGTRSSERLRVHRALGRGELIEGRSLDALQAAYRLGARVAWRRYARIARRAGLSSDRMVALAEAIFAHIDELASAAVLGYAEAKADEAGTLGRRRHQLLDLLVSGAGPAAVRHAAAAADWPLPGSVACVALGPAPAPGSPAAPAAAEHAYATAPAAGRTRGEGGTAGSTPRSHGRGDGSTLNGTSIARGDAGLPPGEPRGRRPRRPRMPDLVLADLDGPDPFLLVPDPALYLRDGQVQRVLHDRGGVIGPTVPLVLAGDSLRWARAIRGCLPESHHGGPVDCDRCLPELVLLGDPALVRLIADRRLSPLAALTPKRGERLAATLLAWLQTNRGSAPDVAARLGIHPQTARQRLHQVQELFGPALADPDARFELEVALRSRLMTSALGAPPREADGVAL